MLSNRHHSYINTMADGEADKYNESFRYRYNFFMDSSLSIRRTSAQFPDSLHLITDPHPETGVIVRFDRRRLVELHCKEIQNLRHQTGRQE